MKSIKKTLIASAVGMAIASVGHAGLLRFDVNGAAGPNQMGLDQFNIDVFDWTPGNLLIKDTVPINAAGANVTAYAQSRLTGVTLGGATQFSYGGLIPGQLSYQLTLNLAPTAAGAGSIKYSQGASVGTFEIFYHGASVASDDTGCGYGSTQSAFCGAFPGSLIYRGTASVVGSANLTDDGIIEAGGLDQSSDGIDRDSGVGTTGLNMGTLRVDINTLTFDGAFFLTNIQGISTDIQHTEQGGGSPFIQANPSDEVVGNVIGRAAADRLSTYGADLVNNFVCGAQQSPCDIHLQSDASSTILTTPTPEPGSLALLGLGLAALGVGVRRRLKK